MPGKLMQFWEEKYKEEIGKVEKELKEKSGNEYGVTQASIKNK
jgi:hypothetical protein